MIRDKISAQLTLGLLPAAGLYLCWWLLNAVGELVVGIAFADYCVWIIFGSYVLKKSGEKIWCA